MRCWCRWRSSQCRVGAIAGCMWYMQMEERVYTVILQLECNVAKNERKKTHGWALACWTTACFMPVLGIVLLDSGLKEIGNGPDISISESSSSKVGFNALVFFELGWVSCFLATPFDSIVVSMWRCFRGGEARLFVASSLIIKLASSTTTNANGKRKKHFNITCISYLITKCDARYPKPISRCDWIPTYMAAFLHLGTKKLYALSRAVTVVTSTITCPNNIILLRMWQLTCSSCYNCYNKKSDYVWVYKLRLTKKSTTPD